MDEFREVARLSCKSLGHDLFSESFDCTGEGCVDNEYDWQIERKIPRKIKFTGYHDTYFFETVNAEPRRYDCKCGKQYRYQWFPGEVVLEELVAGFAALKEQSK